MGKTIAEMIADKFKQPVWRTITNPLEIKIGSHLELDVLDYRDRKWEVEEIREYHENIEGEDFFVTDYLLYGKNMELNSGEDKQCIIRLCKKDRSEDGMTHNVLLLHLSHEHEYDEGLDALLRDDEGEEGGEFQMDDTVFYRLNDVRGCAQFTVTKVNAKTQNFKNKDELDSTNINSWDWITELKDEADQVYNEFLFIETNMNTGWHQFLLGVEIDPTDVTVI